MSQEPAPEMVRIPAGEFVMGSDDGDEDERPAHTVHLDEYFIGVHPITHRQYAHFVRETNHRAPAVYELPLIVTNGGRDRERMFRRLSAQYVWSDSQAPSARLDHPVTLVRLEDAEAYCKWLADTNGRPIRLPTEAEWEKAARGGLERARYPWGNELDPLRANFLTDPSLKMSHGTTPTRTFAPNGYGLYDVIGNVWEWVSDWYAADAYRSAADRNPPGPPDGRLRILRGGGWPVSDIRMLTCTHRHEVPPDTYSYSIGFRIACSESS
ncbi:MAG TPA: formylglycine-generating enzyme family protein [Vicinamibacterales bacterium]|nr:formylglycine-generating enzyme family protein [Vicinamibacterales bacterium]